MRCPINGACKTWRTGDDDDKIAQFCLIDSFIEAEAVSKLLVFGFLNTVAQLAACLHQPQHAAPKLGRIPARIGFGCAGRDARRIIIQGRFLAAMSDRPFQCEASR